MTKALIFDLDGTLADTLPLCVFSFQEALEACTGVRPTKQEVMSHFGACEEGVSKKLLPDNWSGSFSKYLEVYKENHHMCEDLFEGVQEVLDFLKRNKIKTALITGKGAQSCDITLNHFGIREYFEFVETGHPKGSIKPECMRRILKRWGLNPKDAYYVGDSPKDITDSDEVGVNPIAVSWASTAEHDVLLKYKPHKIFSQIPEFKNWVYDTFK